MYRVDNGAMARTIRVGDQVVPVRIRSEGSVEAPCVRVDILSDENNIPLQALERRLSHMLSIDMDLAAFYAHVRRDPALAGLAERFYGMRMLLEPDPFECMIKTIIGQQLNLAFADTLTGRLVRLASPALVYNGTEYPVFPTPEQVARLSYDALRQQQFSLRKAQYVIDFARAVADGKLDLDELYRLEDEEIVARLVKMRGIGRWTVECFLLFGLGRPNLLPAADIGLRNGVKLWFGLDARPTEEQVRRLGESWSPWSSYVTYYLWESLN